VGFVDPFGDVRDRRAFQVGGVLELDAVLGDVDRRQFVGAADQFDDGVAGAGEVPREVSSGVRRGQPVGLRPVKLIIECCSGPVEM
jgi:hypothetical protein